ncbi:hypothetical protein F7731_04045 [Cytobacillus depressus]|uniref:Type II secretion system protein n=1 Tax=Cytobacillus depressus TaxID=1602942 RepID=A0A6L3VAP1_9BACI|nr:hypothetical protein [Cytobacillus depressus]KAB2338728.1 hypothetical protein F7731_04045 [Cytobacillus depressus]
MNIYNEKGYALVTVLLTITIFMVITLTFVAQSTTSAKQNIVLEEKSISTARAEMGITYIEQGVRNIYIEQVNEVKKQHEKDNPKKTFDKYADIIIVNVYNKINYLNGEVNTNKNLLFKIESFNLAKNSDEISLAFTSDGHKNTPITATIKINYGLLLNDFTNNIGGQFTNIPVPPTPNNSIIEENNKHLSEYINKNVIFRYKHGVKVSNGKPLKIENGSAHFTTGLSFSGNPSSLYISGNAFFDQKIEFNGNYEKDNSFSICIKGGTYLWNNSTKKYEVYYISKNSCSNPGNNGNNPPVQQVDPISMSVSYYGKS